MAEYIDKEAVLEHYRVTDPAGTFAYCDSILDFVESIPAANVRPVVRGEWLKGRGEWSNYEYTCSVCGCDLYRHKTYHGEVKLMNFCPHCGADMEGEEG